MNFGESIQSVLNEDWNYGAWLSPSGKLILVKDFQAHEEKAQEILGQEFSGDSDGTDILLTRKWSKLLYDKDKTIALISNPLTASQLRHLKDYSIENNVLVAQESSQTGKETVLFSPSTEVV